jgi:hypothetical protein
MIQDKHTRAILEFAFSQQRPWDALVSVVRAGKLAHLYRFETGGSDFNEIFPSDSKTKKRSEEFSII